MRAHGTSNPWDRLRSRNLAMVCLVALATVGAVSVVRAATTPASPAVPDATGIIRGCRAATGPCA